MQELFISPTYFKFCRSEVKRICESPVANSENFEFTGLKQITSEFSVLANSFVRSLLLTPAYVPTSKAMTHDHSEVNYAVVFQDGTGFHPLILATLDVAIFVGLHNYIVSYTVVDNRKQEHDG